MENYKGYIYIQRYIYKYDRVEGNKINKFYLPNCFSLFVVPLSLICTVRVIFSRIMWRRSIQKGNIL